MDLKQFFERMRSAEDAFVEHAEEVAGASSSWLHEMGEKMCDSPIEILFFAAICLRFSRDRFFRSPHGGDGEFYIREKGSAAPMDLDSWPHGRYGHIDLITTQYPVLGFRSDFAIRRIVNDIFKGRLFRSPLLLVECDGHDFHERTKEQAAHDKSRDRELQTAGFYVLRFTGSEIWKDPAACAEQAYEFLEEHISRQFRESNANGK